MSRDDNQELRALRMEMLRMRASLQRAEVADAVAELRAGTRGVRGVLTGLGGIGAGVAGRSGWVGLAAALARRPWAAALGLSAVRALKRRPVLGAAAVVAGLVAWGFARRAAARGDASSDRYDG